MNIQESVLKIKILNVLIIILSCLGSFFLGKVSVIERGRVPILIDRGAVATPIERIAYPEPVGDTVLKSPETKETRPEKGTKGAFVGSKSGSKYHLPSCPGAKMISEANKIWFSSKSEAEKSGYSPAGNCPNL